MATEAAGADAGADLAALSEASAHGKVTGIIIPPPDVRAVVDKTAEFVAKNGKSFEARIRLSAQGNSHKFDFMGKQDVYHPYYEHKIREFETGTAEEAGRKKREAEAAAKEKKEKEDKERRALEAQAQRETLERSRELVTPIVRAARNVPKARPPPLAFVLPEVSTLTPLDGDVMKLCAQFTALGGRQFLAELTAREERNPQFAFLRPTHMLFSYFTALVDAYVKLLNQTEVLKIELERNLEVDSVIERAVWRWHHERASEAASQAKAEEEAAERQAFAAIDWHDFTIVETIDFGKEELLEAAPAAAPGAPAAGEKADEDDEDMEMEDDEDMDMSDDEDADEAEAEGIKVVTDYQPSARPAAEAAPRLVVDPVSGQTVPIDQVAEHLRIQLIDPKYREQTKVAQERQAESNLASGASIATNLKRFSSHRSDIIGSTAEEELELFKKSQDAKKNAEKETAVTWDDADDVPAPTVVPRPGPARPGPHASGTFAQPNSAHLAAAQAMPAPPRPAAQPPKPPSVSSPLPPIVPEPSHGRATGNSAPVPSQAAAPPAASAPPGPAGPTGADGGGPGPGSAADASLEPSQVSAGDATGDPSKRTNEGAASDAPEPKRPRISEALLSVDDFIQKHPDPYRVNVLVPENATWNLEENAHPVEVTAQTLVKALRDQLTELIGIPGNKFQLRSQATGKFLRDTESFAVANVGPQASLTLVVKSRGGRR